MFEVSNRLVGIYKTEDCTKSVTIENKLPEQNGRDVMAWSVINYICIVYLKYGKWRTECLDTRFSASIYAENW